MEGRAKDKNIIGCKSTEDLCKNLKKPRKVMIMVRAGDPVDATIKSLLPHLEEVRLVRTGSTCTGRYYH
jgi:6-phosphogluconate dehydrogenase